MSPQSPNSVAPAGVPGGNGKYVVVALLLLVGIGALVVWKFVLNKPDDQASLTAPSGSLGAPSITAPANPKLDDVPPPPPPVPEAGPVEAGTKQTVGVGVASNGCDAKCGGAQPPDLASALQGRAAQARRCYNSALAQDSSLKGRVTIAVKISPQGSVCSASVAQTDMPSVGACVAGVFRGGTFPAPRGGCVDAIVPMNFVPAGN
jgi:hypothetical protein